MYRHLSDHYRERFGCKVYKLSLDAGFTCPNRDGTCGTGGCIFCAGDGSGAFAEKGADIAAQLERAKDRVRSKNHSAKYIAYFQSFTNTYAPVETLRRLYLEAIAPEELKRRIFAGEIRDAKTVAGILAYFVYRSEEGAKTN